MTITNLSTFLTVSSSTFPGVSGITGASDIQIFEDLSPLSLNSAYAKEFQNSDLANLTKTYNDFPTVELGGVPVADVSNQPLLLNAMHLIYIRLSKEDPEIAATGYVTVTLTDLGSSSPSTRSLVVGDSFRQLSALGWPADAAGSIGLAGSVDLTNTKVLIVLAGSTVGYGLGYGY